MPLIRFSNLWRRDKILSKLLIITLFCLACYLTQYPGPFDGSVIGGKNGHDQLLERVMCDEKNYSRLHERILAMYKVIGSMERTGQSPSTARPETKQKTVAVFLPVTETEAVVEMCTEQYIKALHILGYLVDIHAMPPNDPKYVIKERPDVALCLFAFCPEKQMDADKVLYIPRTLPALLSHREVLEDVYSRTSEQNVYRIFKPSKTIETDAATKGTTNWIVTQEDGSPSFVAVPETSLQYFVGELRKAPAMRGKLLLQEPFSVLDRPVSLSVFVVAVGMDPAVYYVHKAGLIQIGEYTVLGTSNQGSITQLTWSVQQFKKYLQSKYSVFEIEKFFQDVKTSVDVFLANCKLSTHHNRTVPLTDARACTKETCPRSYQLHITEITVFITKALKPHVVNVAPYPHSEAMHLPNSLVKDVLQTVLATTHAGKLREPNEKSVDRLQQEAADNCKDNEKRSCSPMIDHRLVFEILELFHKSADIGLDYVLVHSHTISALEEQIENFITCNVRSMDVTGLDLPEFDAGSHYEFDSNIKRSCQQDSLFHSLLFSVAFRPDILLTPEFHPLTTLYTANVPFGVTSVEIVFEPAECSNLVAILGNTYPARKATFTLGLGLNMMHIHVVKQNVSVMNAYETLKIYTIRITRESSRGISAKGSLIPDTAHQTCYLRQSCEMQLYPGEACGLTSEFDQNFVLSHNMETIPCKEASQRAQWIIPCRDCQDETSCMWENATWSPEVCAAAVTNYADLSAECFVNKNFVFVGDSTNRGILMYFLQLLNGSLWDEEKIHSIKVYTFPERNVSFSFAYYPQFWVSQNLRPTFKKTVLQGLKALDSVDDNRSTIFVIGGVQFLHTKHLKELDLILRRKKFKRSQVIVKTLGAGFFIHIPGIPHVSQNDLGSLVKNNDDIIRQAQALGFAYVDTLAMTASRYNEFHPGRCSCHFHSMEPSHERNGQESKFVLTGPINALYSRQILRETCSE